MSESLMAIGTLLVIAGLGFGLVYIVPHIPQIIEWLSSFVRNYWWITIIIGMFIFFLGAWHEG
jgi:type II secretory pathway component PulF